MIKENSALDKVLKSIGKIIDFIYFLLVQYAKIQLLLIVIIITTQVFLRNVLKTGINWAEEVSLLLMVWSAFIAMAIGVERKSHVSITVFFDILPKPLQWLLNKINLLISLLLGCVLVIFGAKLVKSAWTSILPATRWPSGMLYLGMPIAGVFIVYFVLLELFSLERYHKAPKGVEEE